MIDQYIHIHGRRLYGLCVHLCKNHFEADDLYQETWIKVVKNIDKYDKTKPFEPWLTKICVNTYCSTLRRISRSPIFNIFTTTEEKEQFLRNIPSEQSPDYTYLHDAVDKLPEKLRVTVILFYFEEQWIDSCDNMNKAYVLKYSEQPGGDSMMLHHYLIYLPAANRESAATGHSTGILGSKVLVKYDQTAPLTNVLLLISSYADEAPDIDIKCDDKKVRVVEEDTDIDIGRFSQIEYTTHIYSADAAVPFGTATATVAVEKVD